MKFRFAYIGPPFSQEQPGAECSFDEHDVPDLRRASHDWMEISDTKEIVVEPKFVKISGRPKQLVIPDSKKV